MYKRLKSTLRIILLLPIALLAACVASGPPFTKVQTVSSDVAGIYIFRSAGWGSGSIPPVFIDGIEIGDMFEASYLYHETEPGKHLVAIGTKSVWDADEVTREVTVDPGTILFLEYVVDFEGASYVGGPGLGIAADLGLSIREVSRDEAIEKLRKTQRSK